MRYTMCGWCRRFNPVSVDLCRQCGHEAHVARPKCACRQCAARHPTPLRALPEPDHVQHARLAFVRWLVASGRLSEHA
jgi:hypothetical protein